MKENPMNQIIIKALKDKKFYEELKQNPKKVLERELKVALPNDLNIKVLEESENQKYLVIPPKEAGELSEAELQNLSGGGTVNQFFVSENTSWIAIQPPGRGTQTK